MDDDFRDPYLEAQQADDTNDLKSWSEGCLLALAVPGGLVLVGLIAALRLFAASSGEAKGNQVLGVMSIAAGLGVLLGGLILLRKVAPGVYLRGLFGLPGLPLSPRAQRIGLYDRRALRWLVGLPACGFTWLVMLGAVSFAMNASEPLGTGLLWAGLLLGPALGGLAAARVGLRDPLPEEFE